jgi:hypothetical protein
MQLIPVLAKVLRPVGRRVKAAPERDMGLVVLPVAGIRDTVADPHFFADQIVYAMTSRHP